MFKQSIVIGTYQYQLQYQLFQIYISNYQWQWQYLQKQQYQRHRNTIAHVCNTVNEEGKGGHQKLTKNERWPIL